MEATLHPLDEPLIDALELAEPCRIAEVGCGGGGTTFELRRRAPAGSIVHGFDISPKLIEVARRRAPPNEPAISFDVADMATAAPSMPYDRLASRLGVMFFDEPEVAFANLVRWLVPGGRFAFAVWARPSENAWMTAVRDAVSQVIDIPKPDPEAPGPFRYGDSGKLLSLLERAGFAELVVRDWEGLLPVGGGLGPADAARFALSAFSNFGELLAKAGDDALGKASRSLATTFAGHEHDGAVRLGGHVRIFTGSRR
jgi:SAM-dependent methyltransferase